MFRIPAFYKVDTTFEEATATMKAHGRGDLLEGMQAMERVWEEHCAAFDYDNPRFEDDSAFYDCYEAEVNAFNVIFETMQPLFA